MSNERVFEIKRLLEGEEKYCSVAVTVRGVAEITQDYTIDEED